MEVREHNNIADITPEDVEQAEGYKGLGPTYFTARRIAARAMEKFEAEQFKPLLDKLLNELRDTLWNSVEDSLLHDVENNIQNHIWNTVDTIVKGILSGEPWVMDRYALGNRYNCDKARAAIVLHIPKELQDARITDLEDEVKRLEYELSAYRRY